MSHPTFDMTETLDEETGLITFRTGVQFQGVYKSTGAMITSMRIPAREIKDGIRQGLKEKILREMCKVLEVEGVVPTREEIIRLETAERELRALKEQMGLPL